MKNPQWRAYHELAWTERLLNTPEQSSAEIELFSRLIEGNAKIKPKTLLHLGCGAGSFDFTFKKYFTVTGVDISADMLDIAQERNPEINYITADMRNFDLQSKFDAIAVPDSIGYLTKAEDLKAVIDNACRHLSPGGVLLIVMNTREDFRENNFIYKGADKDTEVTVFENNFISKADRSRYEATFVYLVRKAGQLDIFTDRHILGLFPIADWLALLGDAGFEVKKKRMDHAYDRYMPGEGQYPLLVLIGIKPL